MESVCYYDYPIGTIGIAEENGAVTRVFYADAKAPKAHANAETPLIKKAAVQLGEYFGGTRKQFDLPLSLRGTDFQRAVWAALISVPFGETRSYKDIAVQIGNPKACRAVGGANHRNPIMIIVPCHRIVGHDGGLGGYACGQAVKRGLLGLENAFYAVP
ncbi:MAG: methylated-DNA--[protein]-cysteine S-methyltransferase [Clostridiales bacterium]|jgi:methylated-DNA-[protein]-cysteine S-methyltransferase|nr:methylated-DNA--[protein]-cysteine S-methyltransferase [Clostridiales bacterium]